MLKPTYRDLTIVLGLSIASLIFLNLPALDIYPIKFIPQILLLLILPGYAAVAVVDPLFSQSENDEKVLLTIAVSLLISISLWLISTYTTVKVFNFITLITLTIVLSILAMIRRKMFHISLRGARDRKDEPKKAAEYDEKTDEERISKVRSEDQESTKNIIENLNLITKETGKESKSQTKKTDLIDKDKLSEYITIPKYSLDLDLILVIILTALCGIFVLVPVLNKTVIRTILGLLLVLFLPGYALIAALFTKKDDLDSIERLALSFGLSIAITPLIGLVLNYTPYGIRLDPILISLIGVTLILSAVAFYRRRRLPLDDHFMVDFSGFFRRLRRSFQGGSKTGKILSVVLILSIILAITTTVYIIAMPKEGESFTEFYILGPNGKASDYPTNLIPNEEGKVIIGIVNHENKNTSYRLLVTSNGTVQLDQTVTLRSGQKIEIPFSFIAGDPGERNMKFMLYKLPDTDNIYRSLHLWINITESSAETGA